MTATIYESLEQALRDGWSVYAPLQLGYLIRRRDQRNEWEYAEIHLRGSNAEGDSVVREDDLPKRILAFIAETADARDAIADVDVPGWVVSKPTIAELNADLAIMVIRSKGDAVPFILPVTTSASIAVLEGSVRFISSARPDGEIKRQHEFYELPAGLHRQLLPLEPGTRVYCTFFRARVSGDGTDQSAPTH